MSGDIENAVPDTPSFAAIADRSNDLTALLTPTGILTFLNAAGRQLLGANGSRQPFFDLLTGADVARFTDEILPLCAAQERWEGNLSFRDRTSARPVSTRASFFTVPGSSTGETFHIVCTAQNRREDTIQIKRQARMLEAATQIASDVLASQSGIEALEHFAEAARQLTGARYAVIGVATSDGDPLDAFVTDGMTHEQAQAIEKNPRGAGVLGLLLARTTPLRLNDLSCYPEFVGFPPNHPPVSAFLGVPIRHGDAVLGGLYLMEKPGRFDEVDEVTVSAFGAHLAVAIRNLQMLKRRRALVAGLIAAQEEERRAVAYDLHDGLTQFVMAAQMHLSVFRGALERGEVILTKDNLRPAFDTAYKYLGDSVVESRRLVNGLRPLALDDMGLAGALEQLIEEEKARAGWREAGFTHNLGSDRFPQMTETALYRIAQEAMTNARKHAAAQTIQVVLLLQANTSGQDQLSLEVRDDGVGFLPASDDTNYTHIGLHGVAERVYLLQGQLKIDSKPGQGTRVMVRLPLLPRERGRA